MWFLITFVALNILSILAYALMHQQISRILEIQERTFHLRNKVSFQKNSALRTRAFYLLIVIGINIYSIFLYLALTSSS